MAAADQSSAPSPTDRLQTKDYIAMRLLLVIGGFVVVGVAALFLLHVLGSLWRRSSHRFLHAAVAGAYTLSYSLVSYTLGLMQSSKYYVVEFPVWAVCLLMLLGSADCLTAGSLDDIDNWKSYCVKHLPQGVLVAWIIWQFGPSSDSDYHYQYPLWAILFIIVLKSYARIASMRMASKSYMLRKNMKQIADYMKQEGASGGQKHNPVTMEGYRYMVAGERRQKFSVKRPEYVLMYDDGDVRITTVEQIWSCTGSLLCCNKSERGLLLRDMCLSMALSKILNRRFAGRLRARRGGA